VTTPDLLKKRGQTDEEDRLSTSSNLSSSQTKPPRKTPNQVKKESEAKKQAKVRKVLLKKTETCVRSKVVPEKILLIMVALIYFITLTWK
jgi:hypothetical protein